MVEENTQEADEIDFTPDAFDTYLGAQFMVPQGDGYTTGTVRKRAKGPDGNPVGRTHANPILDTRMYEVEFSDGSTAEYQANVIAENLFSQVDSEGQQYVLLKEISDHKADESAIPVEDGYDISANGNRTRKRTTRGWKLLVEWKDGNTDWIPLKDMKESYPVELAEYAIANKIADEPAFAWWVRDTLKRRNRIIGKVKSRYWLTTHKYGIEVPKSVQAAYELDRKLGTRHWTVAIEKEMQKIKGMGAFERWDKGTYEDLCSGKLKLPGYQEVKCHMVFDIKLDGKFTRKARFVADGSRTTPPKETTYASVVSRESVGIAFLYAALNELDILGCDISNAYLNAPCREKIWVHAGPEFGSDAGCIMIIRKALYGLKGSGASWRRMLAQTLMDAGYVNTIADPDVWRRLAMTPTGFEYYELCLVFTDDILSVSHEPKKTMDKLSELYDLKDTVKPPERYLGANVGRYTLPDGRDVWSMSGKDYIKNSIPVVREMLEKEGRELPGGKKAERPMPKTYRPEVDVSPLCDDRLASRYMQLIGILRWAVELGRIDIHLEVSLLSSHLCMPRLGHLEAAYNIFGYLAKHLDCNLVFDDERPVLDESVFKEVDWSESVYGDAKEQLPPNMPPPKGNSVCITAFTDANHAGNLVTRRSHTGIIIFINKSPIVWFSKRQNTVESSTFGSEFVAARIATDLIEGLRYKLRMFGIPIDGPASLLCDNNSVVGNSSQLEARLNKKHNAICFHRVREAAAGHWIRVGKKHTSTNIADLLTKMLDTVKRRLHLSQIFPKGGT